MAARAERGSAARSAPRVLFNFIMLFVIVGITLHATLLNVCVLDVTELGDAQSAALGGLMLKPRLDALHVLCSQLASPPNKNSSVPKPCRPRGRVRARLPARAGSHCTTMQTTILEDDDVEQLFGSDEDVRLSPSMENGLFAEQRSERPDAVTYAVYWAAAN